MQTVEHLQSLFEKIQVQVGINHRLQAETAALVELASERKVMIALRCQEGLRRGLAFIRLQFQEEGSHISAITLVALPFCIAYMCLGRLSLHLTYARPSPQSRLLTGYRRGRRRRRTAGH